jgi:hypothetical protein
MHNAPKLIVSERPVIPGNSTFHVATLGARHYSSTAPRRALQNATARNILTRKARIAYALSLPACHATVRQNLGPIRRSRTTGQAAIEEGFVPTLIEREAEYVADIRTRLKTMRGPLFEEAAE